MVDSLGEEKAIEIVKFYLTHNNAWYLGKAHSLQQCLADAEKLHTEWSKQDYIRKPEVSRFESISDNMAVMDRVMNKINSEKENKK